jgi:type VI secretion system protein VasJ
MDLATLRSLGVEPCSAAAPAGESVRYDADFEALAAEIEKLTSVEQTPVDWNRVFSLSGSLLRKGKDLLVGSYLACGAFEKLGYAGLGAACTALQGLLANFWQGLFPELRRLRARIAALDWLAARLEKVLLAKGDPGLRDREGIEEAIASLQAILADEGKLFGGEGPNLSPAIRALRSKLSTIPVPEEPKVESASESAKEKQVEAVAPPPPPPPPPPAPKADNPERVLEVLADGCAKLLEYAQVLQDADGTDARAYVLRRAAVWQSPAIKIEGERVLIDGCIGDASRLAEIQVHLDNGDFADALRLAEELLVKHPLWLDLQLQASMAFDGLGQEVLARARGLPGCVGLSVAPLAWSDRGGGCQGSGSGLSRNAGLVAQ